MRSFVTGLALLGYILLNGSVAAQEFIIEGTDLVNDSAIFGGFSDPVWIEVGDATNDENVDFVVSRHQDFDYGKLAVFQFSMGAWDTGTILEDWSGIDYYNSIQHPWIAEIKNDGDQYAVWLDHYQSNDHGDIRVARYTGTTKVEEYQSIHHVGWPGQIIPGVGDVDDDDLLEIYVLESFNNNWTLYRYDYNPGTDTFDQTVFWGNAGGSAAGATAGEPHFGDFTGTGHTSMAYLYERDNVHIEEDGQPATASYSILDTADSPIWGSSTGHIDNQPGMDLVYSAADYTVYIISGGTFTVTPVPAPETLWAVACADLDGDGKDEIYGAGDTGIYLIKASGAVLLEDHVDMDHWWDGKRALWTGEERDQVVFAGTESTGNITVRVLFAPSLVADVESIPWSSGGVISFDLLGGPTLERRHYFLAGSLGGTFPGVTLPRGEILPLVKDALFKYVLKNFNKPNLVGFRGLLDLDGEATAAFTVPASHPVLTGKTLYFAFTTEFPYDFQSNVKEVIIAP